MMQQMLDKALKDRGQVEAIGGSRGESSGQAGTNREMPGESETGGPQALRVGQWDDRGTRAGRFGCRGPGTRVGAQSATSQPGGAAAAGCGGAWQHQSACHRTVGRRGSASRRE